eukprot:1417232-Pyramimonas_sp.AAC.1
MLLSSMWAEARAAQLLRLFRALAREGVLALRRREVMLEERPALPPVQTTASPSSELPAGALELADPPPSSSSSSSSSDAAAPRADS